MTAVIKAVEFVVALPAYRKRILENTSETAQHHPGGTKGVFFGYDFHVSGDAIGLIEINTNAGGAMLNTVASRAHHACCLNDQELAAATASATIFETSIVAMFQNEWRRCKRAKALQTIAIVDSAPKEQFLYPEFLLFKRLFERAGIHAVIADPSELHFNDGCLWHDGIRIDLVYNRLTDFGFEGAATADLRAAYHADAVVVTPNPQGHALYADKRNLAVLSNDITLQALAVPDEMRHTLTSFIPHTEVVEPEHADRLWENRRHLFFKPSAGYGGRAAYRGDKMTKSVFQEILLGDYVAQAIVLPGQRVVGNAESPNHLKFDIRCYTYDGEVQWTAARLYQGQTTNFRTLGGGFAPVYILPDDQLARTISACECSAHQVTD